MLYCEDCRKRCGYPGSIAFYYKYGTCGLCKKAGYCHDLPAKDLVKKKKEKTKES